MEENHINMNIKETIQFIFDSFKFWFIVNPWEEAVRVRFGKHKKVWEAGVYLKIPHFDRIFVEEIRLRINSMPFQTITSKSGKDITIKCAIGYIINDVAKLYDSLHQPETTITNIAMDKISSYLMVNDDFDEEGLKEDILDELNELDYGIEFKYVKVVSFCAVKAFRLIQDAHWEDESIEMTEMI